MKSRLLALILLFLLGCTTTVSDGGGTETVIGIVMPASNGTTAKTISLYRKDYNPVTENSDVFHADVSESGHFSFPTISHGEYVLHSYNEDSTYSSIKPIVVNVGMLSVDDTLRKPATLNVSLPGTINSGRIFFIRGTDIAVPYSEGTIHEDSLAIIELVDIPPFTGLDLMVQDTNGVEILIKSDVTLLPSTYQVVDHWLIQ